MTEGKDARVIYCNTDSLEIAQEIADALVNDKLAACATVFPDIISVFEWEGKIEHRREYTLMVKTLKDNEDVVEEKILEIHNDDVPEIISVKLDSVHKPYLEWMKDTIKIKKK